MIEDDQAHRPIKSRKTIGRFVGTGVMTAGLYFGLLVALVELAQTGPGTSAAVAYVIAVLFNYFTQKIWTFSDKTTVRRSGLRYALLSLALMGFNAAMMHILVAHVGANYLASQLISAGFLVMISFIAQKTWVFNRPAPGQELNAGSARPPQRSSRG